MLDDVESSLKMTVVFNINVKVDVVVEVEAIFHLQWLPCLVAFCLHDDGCRFSCRGKNMCNISHFFSKITGPLSG